MIPRVSVVMANYNYGRFLREAIDSVLKQTLRDLELIVVDDGSTDDSRKIIESYLPDSRVRFAPVDHLGQPGAKNAGIELARSPLIAFLDADDIWHLDKLKKQVALFDRDPSLGVVYSRRVMIDENGSDLPYSQPRLHRGEVLAEMFRDNFVCFSSAVVRRLVFEHLGMFDTDIDLAIDYDFWLRAAAHYRFDYVDEPLVSYRCGHGNLSRRVGERLKTALLLMRRFLNRGGRERLPAKSIHHALAETSCHMGISLRSYSASASMKWFARSLRQDWKHRLAWRGLAKSMLPGPIRRLLQRGNDWERAYRVPENDPSNL
jgi:glycosyltransferase involved in cell wall biosynthesis